MITVGNNQKTTAPGSERLSRTQRVAHDALHSRGSRGRGAPQVALDAEHDEVRGRGRGRARGRQRQAIERDRMGDQAARLEPVTDQVVPTQRMAPRLAERIAAQRGLVPAQTISARFGGGLPGQKGGAAPGFHLPIEMDSLLSALPEEAFLPNLSLRKKCAIINEARRLDTALDYSTAALVLALARRARLREAATDSEVRFADVMGEMPMDAHELVNTYHGGTCFSLAGHLKKHLKSKFNVPGFALVSEGAPLQMAFWPSLIKHKAIVGIEDIKQHVNYLGHTDLAVPYMQGKDRRVLVLPTGQPEGAFHYDGSMLQREADLGDERLLDNPQTVAYRALWGRFRLHIGKRTDNSIFGIDFLVGEMYINKVAVNQLQRLLQGSQGGSFEPQFNYTFNFAGLSPNDPLALTYETDERWQECIKFLALINRVFNLGNEALQDILYLIDRRENYLTDVVHPWAKTMRDTSQDRAPVLKMTAELEQAEVKHPKTAQKTGAWTTLQLLRGHLHSAEAHVLAGDAQAAKLAYHKAHIQAEQALQLFANRRRS